MVEERWSKVCGGEKAHDICIATLCCIGALQTTAILCSSPRRWRSSGDIVYVSRWPLKESLEYMCVYVARSGVAMWIDYPRRFGAICCGCVALSLTYSAVMRRILQPAWRIGLKTHWSMPSNSFRLCVFGPNRSGCFLWGASRPHCIKCLWAID